jgi:dipeptidase
MAPVYYTDGQFPRWVSNDSTWGPGYRPNAFTGPKLSEPIGYILQVSHTYAYWDANFGIINEHNVAMDETTCSAMLYTCAKGDTRHCGPNRTSGEALLDIRMLTSFGLQRATTARQAIEVMGALAYEYGFYGSHDPNGDGESLMVADAHEAWVFHILADPTGKKAIWVAKRVPDDSMVVVANMFTIRDVDVEDTANCMASPNLHSVAESLGWWKPGDVFDFTRIYSNGEYNNKYYSGRRMWRGLSLTAPSLKLSPHYTDLRYDRTWPWAVKPDKPIVLEEVFSLYRDYYVGTEFDMTKGLAAGFGGTPDRFDTSTNVPGAWERSIALYRTNVIKVQHLQAPSASLPKEVSGVAWICQGPAHHTPFVPIPSGFKLQIAPLTNFALKDHNRESLNWAARKVMMTSQINFKYMHPVVEKSQRALETAGIASVKSMGEAVARNAAWHHVIIDHMDHALKTWQHLGDELIFHFSDNSDIPRMYVTPLNLESEQRRNGMFRTENLQSFSYPDWWLRTVGFSEGPPPVPTERQCPPLCGEALNLSDPATRTSGLWLTLCGVMLGAFALFFRRVRWCRSPREDSQFAYIHF